MGAAVAWHARRLGLNVVGIDRHDPPHTFGSTHAETRVTRLAVGEGPQYLLLVARSHELWREIEALTGEALLHQCGGLIVTEPVLSGTRWNDFATVTAEIARAAGIAFSLERPQDVRARFPPLRISDAVRVGYEPTGALVMAERALIAQIALAREAGAEIRTRETVRSFEPQAQHVEVRTDRQRYCAGHVVLASGPWFGEMAAPEHAALVRVTRQVVYWFEAEDVAAFATDHFPYVMWAGSSDEDYLGVFPVPPGGTPAVKLVSEQFGRATTPDTVERRVSSDEITAFHARHVAPKLEGVSAHCVKAEVCLYSNTKDDHFLIDRDPRSERIVVMSACSGHGFKHSAALGEAVAELVAHGESRLDLGAFRQRTGRSGAG